MPSRSYRGLVPDSTTAPTENVLILSCPDQRGIVATVTALLFEHGANIEESQQFDDVRTDQFFMRIGSPSRPVGPTRRWRELFVPVAGIRHGVVDPRRGDPTARSSW